LLGLPEMVVPVASLAVGWPESTPELTDRLPLDIVIHRNRYKEYSDEEIREAYKGKENLESSINFVRVNNKENLAKVFTDVRYNKKDNEYFSARFLDAIRSQGFDM
jgi:predicted Holliday junction resolvase-like endonuclease